MTEYVFTIVTGLIATLAMTTVMYLIHGFGLANGDMVRAVGSYVTKRYHKSFGPGLFIHFTVGIIFALLYVSVWNFIDMKEPFQLLFTGLFFGGLHGLVVSIFMVIMVAEHHPLARFRQVGFAVALTHVAGHLIYGLVVGGLFACASLFFMS